MFPIASLSARLIAAVSAVLVIVWISGVVSAGFILNHELSEAYDSAMRQTAERLLPLAVHDLYGRTPSTAPARIALLHDDDEEEDEEDGGIVYQVRGRDGAVLMHSRDTSAEPFDAPLVSGFRESDGRRIYTAAAVRGNFFIQVAESLEYRRETIGETLFALLVPLAFLMPVSILIMWLIIDRSLRPIARLRGEIADRDGGNLTALSRDGLPVELDRIARSVNLLLERLERSLAAERAFAANSAHELRTPIAGALAQTQRLAAELGDQPMMRRVRQVEESLLRIRNLSVKLLELSRADAGIALVAEKQDLLPALVQVVDEFTRLNETASEIVLDTGDRVDFIVAMDMDAFAIVLRNLIENALRHGLQGVPVLVAIADAGTIRVVNAGPVVSPDKLERLKQRFERANTETAGSGLGLAIADSIMGQSGGSLTLTSPASGREDGFEAQLRFRP